MACRVVASSRVVRVYTWRNDLLFCVNSPLPPFHCYSGGAAAGVFSACAKVLGGRRKGRGPAILPFLLFLRCCRVPSASSFSSRRSGSTAQRSPPARFSARMPATLQVPPAPPAPRGTRELQSQQVRPARLVLPRRLGTLASLPSSRPLKPRRRPP